jgi:hypothetical protein
MDEKLTFHEIMTRKKVPGYAKREAHGFAIKDSPGKSIAARGDLVLEADSPEGVDRMIVNVLKEEAALKKFADALAKGKEKAEAAAKAQDEPTKPEASKR